MTLVSSLAPVRQARRAPAQVRRLAPQRPAYRLYEGGAEALAQGCGMVVTPNLDHLRLLTLSRAFRRAYAQADVVVNDSRFLDRLALAGRATCLPGSELAPLMLDAAAPWARVVVIGGDEAVRGHLVRACASLDFTFLDPSMGYIRKRGERRALAAAVIGARPDLVFVCTGAPQSELMAAQLKRAGCGAAILCCGSAFHFLAGAKRRAPPAFRELGAEWLWRFACEAPTRKRYAADALFLLRRLPAFVALRTAGRTSFPGFALSAGRSAAG